MDEMIEFKKLFVQTLPQRTVIAAALVIAVPLVIRQLNPDFMLFNYTKAVFSTDIEHGIFAYSSCAAASLLCAVAAERKWNRR